MSQQCINGDPRHVLRDASVEVRDGRQHGTAADTEADDTNDRVHAILVSDDQRSSTVSLSYKSHCKYCLL